ncbi:MAG: hypothetical protein D6800_07740 [Candidatus Zixiibacteriota bacterium]|nr:MAG: hypothetical protein D6800_07740 [candidate division Zixibacteria bacterium]
MKQRYSNPFSLFLVVLVVAFFTAVSKPITASGQSTGDDPAQSPAKGSSETKPAATDDSSQETATDDTESEDDRPRYTALAAKYLEKLEKTFGDPPGMTRLDKHSRVWVDRDKKRVVVDGYVALRSGQLEMFACLTGTKEHESVVAVYSKALVVHAGLLAIGAKQGHPVQWEPTFKPPTGSEIQVFVLWKDEQGKKHHTDARQWIRQIGTDGKVLETNWVFAGSSFWKDPDSGKEIYLAESGDLICVSNFSTATLDVPIESSQVNSGLMFAAFTERIPPQGTPVRLVLQLVDKEKEKRQETARSDSTSGLNQLNTSPK